MKFFKPKLCDGRPIKFPFQFYGYFCNFIFPLSSEAGWFQHLLKNFGFIISCSFYCTSLFHEFTYIYMNIKDLPGIVECLSTIFAGGQFLVRLFFFVSLQKTFVNVLTRFYAEIYYDEKLSADKLEFLRPLRLHEKVIDYFTKFYISPGSFFVINFIVETSQYNLWTNKNKPYFFRMAFFLYDAQQPFAYVITAIYAGWLAVSVVLMMMMGDFILCTILLHLTYRFKALRTRIENIYQTAEQNSKNEFEKQKVFCKELSDIIRQQQDLQSFIDEARSYFTYQIFIGLLCGIFLNCLVLFLLQETPINMEWIKYISWLMIQIMQIVGIGYYGQMLTDETSGMQDSFMNSQWEKLLPYGDPQTNRILMLDIKFAIHNAQKPVVFDGLKMFVLTHQTIAMALRSAMSYFMFIRTMSSE